MTGLLDLPIELREHIYEQYLALLRPATFKLVKYPRRPCWTLITTESRRAPVLLLVCRSVSEEFRKIKSGLIDAGPMEAVPLSQGPTIVMDPRWRGPNNGDLSETDQKTREDDDIPDVLMPILLTSVHSISLRLVMPQSPTDAATFISMLRFVVALCRAKTTPLRRVRAIRDPVSGAGWAADAGAVLDEVAKIPCEVLERQNWYQQWLGHDRHAAERNPHDRSIASVSENKRDNEVDEAWQEVLASCQHNEDPWLG